MLTIGNLIHIVCAFSNRYFSFKVMGVKEKCVFPISIVIGLLITEKNRNYIY